jgi:hypothetical protein
MLRQMPSDAVSATAGRPLTWAYPLIQAVRDALSCGPGCHRLDDCPSIKILRQPDRYAVVYPNRRSSRWDPAARLSVGDLATEA